MSQSIPSGNDGTRPKKRPRSSDVVAGPSKTKNSQKYWFEDGNIILRVNNTLFRPATSDGELVIEGCTVVDLPGDKSEDWERVFRVIYDFDTEYKKEGKLPIQILTSMLRLGRKYQFDVVFNEAFARVAAVLPTKLDEWNGIPKELDLDTGGPFRLICILLEIGNQTLLPILYFFCSYYDATNIFLACKHIANFEGIPPATLEKLLVGREKISAASVKHQLDWVFVHMSIVDPVNYRRSCQFSPASACRESKIGFMRHILPGPPPFLALMSGAKVIEMMGGKLCSECAKEISTAHDKSRVTMWAELPSFFGLPDWKDLKDV